MINRAKCTKTSSRPFFFLIFGNAALITSSLEYFIFLFVIIKCSIAVLSVFLLPSGVLNRILSNKCHHVTDYDSLAMAYQPQN